MSVVVRGSCNIDEVFSVPHVVLPGQTISAGRRFERKAGGKGANQAVAVSRAGVSVAFAGCIGKDGALVRDAFDSHQVDTSYLVESDLPTGRAFIQVARDGENAIVLAQGANFDDADVSKRIAYSKYRFVMLQNEIPLQQTLLAIKEAKRASCHAVWNPSPLPDDDDLANVPWDSLDWLVLNEGEAQALLRALAGDSIASTDLLSSINSLPALQNVNLVVTLGARGAAASFGGKQVKVPSGKLNNQVVDTTGAGDTFTGFFVAALAAKCGDTYGLDDVEKALRHGCQAAAIAVERKGAIESIPSFVEVLERLS